MQIALRIIIDCLIFICIFAGPWWLAVFLAVGSAFYFKNYYELIAVGFLIDVFFGVPRARFYNFQYLITVFCLAFFIPIQFIKSRIRKTVW